MSFCPSEVFSFSLYLHPRALVTGSAVYMKDIARVAGELHAPAISQILVMRDIRSPVFITNEQLREKLQGSSERLDRIFGTGVWIVPINRQFTSDELSSILKTQIRALQGGDAFLQKSVLRIESSNIHSVLEGADILFRLPSRASALSPGRRVFSLDLTTRDAAGRPVTLERQQVTVHIFRKEEIPVAARDLTPGEILNDGDWIIETREVDSLDTRYPSGQLRGRRVLTAIHKGMELRAAAVQFLPAVRRGQTIEVVHQGIGIVIKCRSVAGRDGNVGDLIPVRLVLPSGGRTQSRQARIVADGSAVLETDQ